MNFNGLAIFQSSLKPNAKDIIVEIIESGASFKMITGDALNTSQFIYRSVINKDLEFEE